MSQMGQMGQNEDPNAFSAVPQPMPEHLWGDRWQFVRLTAEDLEFRLLERSIPIRAIASLARPSEHAIAPNTLIPGVMIEAGKQSMRLARWVAEQQPWSLEAVNRELGALMLRTKGDRWIMATYQDEVVKEAAENFEALKRENSGIHFLLIQPDDTGTTHSGLWILR
jgi:RNA-binding protein Tab2/Atab2